jgi:hypothetical protein
LGIESALTLPEEQPGTDGRIEDDAGEFHLLAQYFFRLVKRLSLIGVKVFTAT